MAVGINFYILSKLADKNILKFQKLEQELSQKYKAGYGNELSNANTLNEFLRLTMPRHYRMIATYYSTKKESNLYFIEEDWRKDASDYNQLVASWIQQLHEHEKDVTIYDDFGNVYSVDELVSTQLHLDEKEPSLIFEPLECYLEQPKTVGDMIDSDEIMEGNKPLQSAFSVDTYVLVEPKASHYVNAFLKELWTMQGTVKPKERERYRTVAIGQLLTNDYYVPFADVPRGKGIVAFYCPITEIEYKTVLEEAVDEDGNPQFGSDGKPLMQRAVMFNDDGEPVYRFKGIPNAVAMFNLLKSNPKNVPFSLYRLANGQYHRASRESVLEQVKNACEMGADDAEQAYKQYAEWQKIDSDFGLFTPEDEPLLPIPVPFYKGTTYMPDEIQYVPLEDKGKYYIVAEMDIHDETAQ